MAVITATGTWSALQNTLPTSQAPGGDPNEVIRQHRDTVEQRFQQTSLAYRPSFEDNVDGFQEVMEFAGCFAAGYGIPARAALTRIRDIIKAMIGTEKVEDERVFTP